MHPLTSRNKPKINLSRKLGLVRKGRRVWTVAQLQTFLQQARSDRLFALWVLEATSGMRRCELAGAQRALLDLDAGTLTIEVTRVVVDGQVIESDGKTENAQRILALDPFTLAALRVHVEMLDQERADFGPDYQDHGLLFCWENGKPPHPDTITRRFHWLGERPGSPGSTCTTYATFSLLSFRVAIAAIGGKRTCGLRCSTNSSSLPLVAEVCETGQLPSRAGQLQHGYHRTQRVRREAIATRPRGVTRRSTGKRSARASATPTLRSRCGSTSRPTWKPTARSPARSPR